MVNDTPVNGHTRAKVSFIESLEGDNFYFDSSPLSQHLPKACFQPGQSRPTELTQVFLTRFRRLLSSPILRAAPGFIHQRRQYMIFPSSRQPQVITRKSLDYKTKPLQ